MNRGKGEIKTGHRSPSGIVTRAGKTSSIPKPRALGTPKMEEKQKSSTDIQRVLDRLDSIETSLEAKIDDVISSQELTGEKTSERIKKTEDAVLVNTEHVSVLKDDTKGVKVQLKSHGARLAELEDKIERIEREKRRTTLIIEG